MTELEKITYLHYQYRSIIQTLPSYTEWFTFTLCDNFMIEQSIHLLVSYMLYKVFIEECLICTGIAMSSLFTHVYTSAHILYIFNWSIFIFGGLIAINPHLNSISCVGGLLYTEPWGRLNTTAAGKDF